MPKEDLRHFHEQGAYSFQAMRLVSEGLDFMEIARVLRRVESPADWTREMEKAGDRWYGIAEEASGSGRRETAAMAYQTATQFLLGAALWNTPDPWSTVDVYRKAVESFRQFTQLLNPQPLAVEIPYGDQSLPGYLFIPSGSDAPVPAVVLMGGADATKEEAHGFGVSMLLERGMACLILDGPGQGESLRFRRLFAVPEYEGVYQAAIDYLKTVDRLDASRIGIVGLSMGGYYVMRGAVNKEVSAAVSWGALMSLTGLNLSILGPTVRFITGAQSDEEMMDAAKRFTLEEVAGKVRCPVLLVHGGQDHLVAREQLDAVRDALTSAPVDVHYYEDALHCCIDQYSVVRPRIFDWLKGKLS